MIYKQEEWAWGQDGEFGIGVQYDVNDIVEHPYGVCPLNVYGMTMLYDYLALHDIALKDPTEG